tara:strand:+ start:196 stop:468 length:273 start_codon:yes stop_codon:yes gene_type:complete
MSHFAQQAGALNGAGCNGFKLNGTTYGTTPSGGVVDKGTTLTSPSRCRRRGERTTTGLRFTISGGRNPPSEKSQSKTEPVRGANFMANHQ